MSLEPSATERKLAFQHNHRSSATTQHFITFSSTIEYCRVNEVREVLQYGASRRSISVRRSADIICQLAPWNRKNPLSMDESHEVTDALLLIYVHMMGVFDAFSIALYRINRDRFSISERDADLVSRKFRSQLGNSEIDEIFLKNDRWFRRIKDELRNRFVHRIPPYIPHAAWSKQEAVEYKALEQAKHFALLENRIEEHAEISERQSRLGRFNAVIMFTESNAMMHLHPTVLDDVFRFQVISMGVLEALVPYLDLREV